MVTRSLYQLRVIAAVLRPDGVARWWQFLNGVDSDVKAGKRLQGGRLGFGEE
jgi:hypothetical protein